MGLRVNTGGWLGRQLGLLVVTPRAAFPQQGQASCQHGSLSVRGLRAWGPDVSASCHQAEAVPAGDSQGMQKHLGATSSWSRSSHKPAQAQGKEN